jgi:hypothetical protein
MINKGNHCRILLIIKYLISTMDNKDWRMDLKIWYYSLHLKANLNRKINCIIYYPAKKSYIMRILNKGHWKNLTWVLRNYLRWVRLLKNLNMIKLVLISQTKAIKATIIIKTLLVNLQLVSTLCDNLCLVYGSKVYIHISGNSVLSFVFFFIHILCLLFFHSFLYIIWSSTLFIDNYSSWNEIIRRIILTRSRSIRMLIDYYFILF